jgi:hypothetical protein
MADEGPRPISLDDLDRMGINSRNELFWDGKQVEVRSRLNLTWPQTLGAILVGAAAICGGLASAANDGSEFACRQWHVFCGHEAPVSPTAAPPASKTGSTPASDR